MESKPTSTKRSPQQHFCALIFVIPGKEVTARGLDHHQVGTNPILVSYADGVRSRREFFCSFEHLAEWIDKRKALGYFTKVAFGQEEKE